jgi:hypothetical protein
MLVDPALPPRAPHLLRPCGRSPLAASAHAPAALRRGPREAGVPHYGWAPRALPRVELPGHRRAAHS